jgi:hypothetical protein
MIFMDVPIDPPDPEGRSMGRSAQDDPRRDACHICKRRLDEPGEIWCSAVHPLASDEQPAASRWPRKYVELAPGWWLTLLALVGVFVGLRFLL